MPEIPEVEAFKAYIHSHCMHKKIDAVMVHDARLIKAVSAAEFKKIVTGSKFEAIERKGKYLLISLAPAGHIVVMHFGLTGFVVVADADTAVRFEEVDFVFKAKKLAWCTVRKFAKIWLVKETDQIPALKTLGPDPLKLSASEFLAIMHQNGKKNIKALLMDQDSLAGIGNEYSDEILFQAGIDPHHAVKDLSEQRLKNIYTQMKKVLRYAIALRKENVTKLSKGRMFSADDSTLFKSSYLQAHRHTDMLCPKNKNHHLKKVTIAGRSSYYCPIDQK